MQHLQFAHSQASARTSDRGPPLEALSTDAPGDPLAASGLGLITRDLGHRAGAEKTILALRDGAKGPVDVVSSWDADPGADDLPRPPLADGFVGRVLESEHSAVEPISAGDRLSHATGAPVATPEGTTGALCAAFSTAPAAEAALWVVESYARFAALCLHDPDVFEGLLKAARRDALTGCLCYAAVHQELTREIRRSARSGRSLSCCFIDLDRFKAVNDTHGHLYGNRVLAGVAEMLRDGVRDGDTLGRYGGDEFVAVLPDTEEAAAHLLARRLRTAIVAGQARDGKPTVDASIGVAQWQRGSTVDEMLGAADDALRSAKALGGGVVIRASDLKTRSLPGKTWRTA